VAAKEAPQGGRFRISGMVGMAASREPRHTAVQFLVTDGETIP
jgi:cytochrome c-type biogenesis protein CcmE